MPILLPSILGSGPLNVFVFTAMTLNLEFLLLSIGIGYKYGSRRVKKRMIFFNNLSHFKDMNSKNDCRLRLKNPK